ncbi:CDP-alcohol phosphatidyltransferase family protein [Candidatus Dependentiae bacterium]
MGFTLKMFTLDKLRKKGKQKLFVIPYFFTFANAVFGLLSVIKTLEGDFVGAAYCIMFAGLMDLFDGKLARAFGSTSYLGMELDSLCDAVSFCFAPAILLYSWYFHNLGLIGLFVLSLYLCCGLLRLAKFNISSANKSKNINYFVGLTTTVSAFLIAQMVIHFQWISQNLLLFLKYPVGIALFVTAIAMLMVSPIPFLSFKKINPKLSIVGGSLVSIVFIIGFLKGFPLLFIGLFAYVLGCISYFIFSRISQLSVS